jgi:5-hydroxydodecatetraenal polyketide synthase CpkA
MMVASEDEGGAVSQDCDLGGHVAVVSGGGRGIGRLTAARLARAVVTAEIKQCGGSVTAAPCDVSDAPTAAVAIGEIERKLGPVTLLINNAGISRPAGPLWETDRDSWWRTFEVNVGGAFTLAQLLLPGMTAARTGRIINITSHAGVYRWPLMSAYATSKAALIKLIETLAEETRPYRVPVFTGSVGTGSVRVHRRVPAAR